MKTWKLAGALGAAATALLGAHAAQAADTVTFAGAGSSAQFNVFAQAAQDSNYIHHYSIKSGNGFAISDPSDPAESAQVWVCWTGDAAGSRSVAFFAQVDSTVGVRAFFNRDTLTVPSTAPAPANLIPSGGTQGDATDTALPADVQAAITGAQINVGVSDITAADALFATQRSIGLGYGPGKSILSSQSGATATPVPFSLSSRSATENPVGASPIVVFVNSNNTAAGHFGTISTASSQTSDYQFNNIDRFVLAGFLSGQLDLTRDIDPALGMAVPVHTFIREPLSGTYNTTEYCNPESVEVTGFTAGAGQEFANAGPAENPLNEPASGSLAGLPDGGGRLRAIGTGELINAVNNTPAAASYDALGYAFWSVANFNGKTNLRYLTVDGADPLLDNYTSGALTGISPTFRNIVNGGYPLWSLLRAYTDNSIGGTVGAGVAAIVKQALSENPTTNGSLDFVKNSNLMVRRLFRNRAGSAGDVGGAVFTKTAYSDFTTDFTPLDAPAGPGFQQ